MIITFKFCFLASFHGRKWKFLAKMILWIQLERQKDWQFHKLQWTVTEYIIVLCFCWCVLRQDSSEPQPSPDETQEMHLTFPKQALVLHVCSTSLLKTLWEKEKLLITSNFSFSHSVFYPFGELPAIFFKFEIVVC